MLVMKSWMSCLPNLHQMGKQLIAVLDELGFRQPYVINTENGSATPVLKGNFEAHRILSFSADSKEMFVLANRDDFAAMNVFKVKLETGEMTALGEPGDFHRTTTVAENAQRLASVAGQWSKRPELKLI